MKALNTTFFKTKALYWGQEGLLFFLLWAARVPLAAIFLFFTLAFYLTKLSAGFGRRRRHFLPVGFLFFLGVFGARLLNDYSAAPAYLSPLAAMAILVSLLYRDIELSIIFSFLLGLLTAMIYGGDLYLAAVLVTGSILASLCVVNARRRSRIILAGVGVGLVQAVSVLLPPSSLYFHPASWLKFCALPFLGGMISAFLAAGLLPVFEFLFNATTNISLLELADFNHPLLKRLVLEAPGTYHHSLMVGNLAQEAAEAIGANAMLARVGAYYHDIGKLHKPEYFSENQAAAKNKHEELSASISRLVIMDHVKTGVELARKSRLNAALIDFILEHHGTSSVFYFYRRALEQTREPGVNEDNFRYPGPKPASKETAIVLLGDCVEAACRALEEPTATRIAELVERIVNNKFVDGQLDSCDLTLRDLEKIAATFTRVLAHFYHSRVSYPEAA